MKKLILLNWSPKASQINNSEQLLIVKTMLASDKFDATIETYNKELITLLETALKEGKLDSLSVYVEATDTAYEYDPDDVDTLNYWKHMYTEL